MKKFVEASFKVDVAGLPPIFMDAKSSVEIRKKLRRQLKFPDDIENIERITKGEKIKSFKDRLKSTLDGKGSDVKESAAYHTGLSKSTKSKRKAQFDKQAKMADDNPAAYKPAPGDATAKTKPSVHTKKYKAMYGTEDYSIGLDGKKLKASKALIRRYEEDMLIDPKAMAKKTRFLSPQNKDKLKTDLAKLKKALGPDHPMNKAKTESKVDELIQFAPAAMAVGAAAVRAAPAAGAVVHSAQKTAKKIYKKFTGKEETDLEEKKKKLTKAQRNKKMRAADRARDKRIRKGNPFNVQV